MKKHNQKKMDNHNGSFYSGFTADNCRFFYCPVQKQPAEDTAAEQIVAVNEVQQLIRRGEDEQAALKTTGFKRKNAGRTDKRSCTV